MDTLLQDLHYAIRTLVRSPGFTLAAVLTMALGIGANATVFGVVDALLLRPPAHVAEPDRLVMVYTSDFSGPPYGASSYPDAEEFRAAAVFEGVATFSPRALTLGEGASLERVQAELVSADYFGVLGTPVWPGRAFAAEESRSGTAPAAVISYGLWQRRFAGDPGVIGRAVRMNGVPVTIIGVAPERFRGRLAGMPVDAWIPAAAGPALGFGEAESLASRGNRDALVVARLRPGITLAAAEAGMALLAERLHRTYPEAWRDVNDRGRRITLVPERAARVPPAVRGPVLGVVGLLAAVAGMVLLVCCANLAGLLLARATRRTREMAIRASLGAVRGRIVRQLLTESLVLACAGAAVGLLIAAWAADLFAALELPLLPVRLEPEIGLGARAVGFTAALTIVAGLLFGLAPALRVSRSELVDTLRSESGATTSDRRRLTLRNGLVVGQLAVSLMLVAGALQFARSLTHAAQVELGFDANDVLLVRLEPGAGEREVEARTRVAGALRERVAALPGVTAASWATYVPFGPGSSRWGMSVEGYRPAAGEDMEFHTSVVGPDYFRALGIPLLSGRVFTDAEHAGEPATVVVNEAFARRFWPDGDALGRRILIGGSPLEVIGVTVTGRYQSPAEEPRPFVYLPSLVFPQPLTLIVRTARDPLPLAAAIRHDAEAAVPGWSIASVRTMDDHVANAVLIQRVAGAVLGVLGLLALGLASLGLYGVVAYSVAERTREIGIRVALGAGRGDVARLIAGTGIGIVAVGALAGLAAAFVLNRLLESLLLGTSPRDPLPFLGAMLVLTTVAFVAAYVPARRALRVDPAVALRPD